jgi:hypothetical protein
MLRLPSLARVPVTPLDWGHACRLVPAKFQAADCFERILDPGENALGETLARLSELTAAAGGDLRLMDPSQVLFGAGAGWINAAYAVPRPARFSTSRHGAFYVAGDIETCVAEVRHHLEQAYPREGITQALDLDYRGLAVHLQGPFHDIRGKAQTRAPWSAVYDPVDYTASQAFAEALHAVHAKGLAYDSVRNRGGACAAVFDPNVLRACRHDTYLAFRWDGARVTRVIEKRILALRPSSNP